MGCGASNQMKSITSPKQKKITVQNKNHQASGGTKEDALLIQDLDMSHDDNTQHRASSAQTKAKEEEKVKDKTAMGVLKDEDQNMRYKKGQLIDKGAYGKVFKGTDTQTDQVVAIKSIELSGTFEQVKKEIASLKKEISLLKKLNHPNIVKYVDFQVNYETSGVDIILEYVPNGSVRMALNNIKNFEEPKVALYTKQILEGLNYLHKNNIIHRDLKGANLLLDKDGVVKLTDFGTAKQIVTDLQKSQTLEHEDLAQMNKSLKGTPNWMAPEVIERTGHSRSADIWSIGCVVLEMLTGRPPYPGMNAKEVFIKIASGGLPEFPKNISEECRQFLNSCLQYDPKKRLSAGQLLQSAFILQKKQTSNRKIVEIENGDTPQGDNSPILRNTTTKRMSGIQLKQNEWNSSSRPPLPYSDKFQQQQVNQPLSIQQQPRIISEPQFQEKSIPIIQQQQPYKQNQVNPDKLTFNQQNTQVPLEKPPYIQAGSQKRISPQQYLDESDDQMLPFTSEKQMIPVVARNQEQNQTQKRNSSLNNQRYTYEEYQNAAQEQLKDKTKNLNNPQKSEKDIPSEDQILQIAKMVRRQQDYVQMNMPNNRLGKQPSRIIYEVQEIIGGNQKPIGVVSIGGNQDQEQIMRKSPSQQFKISQNNIIEDLDEFQEQQQARGSQKSITVNLQRGKSQQGGQLETKAVRFKQDITNNRNINENGINYEDEELENTKENPYRKHENQVISSKLNYEKMGIPKLRTAEQPQMVLNGVPDPVNNVINTTVAQRDRALAAKETEITTKDKAKRQQAWEEELQRELEFQRLNPPAYYKY